MTRPNTREEPELSLVQQDHYARDETDIRRNNWKGIGFAFATAMVASTAAAATKWISSIVPVPLIVLSQYSVCLLILMPWLARQSTQELVTRHWKTHLLRGFAGWLCFFAYFAALSRISLMEASLLRNAAPIFVPLVAWIWARSQITLIHWLPIILGLMGITLILQPDINGISNGHFFGLLSGLTLAVSMVGTRILSRTDRPSLILLYYVIISFICSLPLGIYYWQPIPIWTLPYLAFNGISVLLAIWLYTQAYSYAKPSVVSPISYFGVVIAGFFGWLIWRHLPNTAAVLGTLFVIGAGLLTVYFSTQHTAFARSSPN
ncbi:DMT family transporter [Microbulbifer sp. OS29]|uniref:DMT family transporter n=1 Tax=Microbulbifer okhotskensis TaxID=2926617 RepID=A0A9X2J6Q1_9GAMM|nr:DMT family transporter [Microbulbifer okhotskensis]MCO1335654.1 DMT family transporter [Microbulbifer okhotskensis]